MCTAKGNWAKTENPLLFLVPEVSKLTLRLFFEGIDLFDFFLFFCISAIVDQLNQREKSNGQLVNENLSFVPSGNGVSSLPET